MTKILIADDHPICATALKMALHSIDPQMDIVDAKTFADVERAARVEKFDLILLDIVLPDVTGMSGLIALRKIQPTANIAMISSNDTPDIMKQAGRLGARGFISKSRSMGEMKDALRILLDGGQYFCDSIFSENDNDDEDAIGEQLVASLSAAQFRVLRAAASGLQTKLIAHELNLSVPTIKSHLTAIYRKLGVSNRTQAMVMFNNLSPANSDTGSENMAERRLG